ncbi:cytochrome P450 3A6 [Zopfia rhizophila CBS 207.26]|uniref:Cytochrome P450 3A6 n=1 Tax=Zopfia rhizophila CBS 207.26 TaxID=1314779 RepID=A0A6A6EQ21_9PEZI|nr:cytochrome P450 3A6 [Zopfia rhizophila CBS 207.26]
MASPLHTLGVAIILAFLVYHYIIYPTFLSPLSKIPNAHFTCPIHPLWMWWKRRGGREGVHSIFSAHQRKGPVVRLGPNEVSVASLDGLRQIYVGGFGKPKWYAEQFMNYETPNLVSMVSPKDHAGRRRMLSHVYSKSYLLNSKDMQVLSSAIIFDRLFPILEAAAQDSKPLDLYQANRALGADFMSAFVFGLTNSTNLTCNTTERQEFFHNHDELLRNPAEKGKARQEIEGYGLELCQAANALLRRPSAKMKSSTTASTEPVVYAQLYSRLPKESLKTNAAISPALASETLDHFVAGPEGTRTTLTFLQWELSKRPALQARLRNELFTLDPPVQPTFRTHPNSPNGQVTQRLPSFQALDALPLLDAIVQETLRLYPASQAPQFRITPPGGCTLEKRFYVPGGVRIGTAVFCMHRNEDIFPNASSWEPERWMKEQDSARLKEMRRWFWAFGSGPRTCTGRYFVVLVMKILIAAIYTNYTTSIVDDEGMEQEDTFLGHPVGEKLVLRLSSVV